MRNIIPLTAYYGDETGTWKRLPFVCGLYFGFAMAIFAAIYPIDDSGLFYSRATRVVFAFFFGGIGFGILFPFLARRKARTMQRDLYIGKPSIDEPPPPNKRLEYRFPCTLVREHLSSVVGGAMYLGRDGMIFVPHKRNRRPANALEMGPLSGLGIDAVAPPTLSLKERILIPHPKRLLEVRWSEGSARFSVPYVDTFLPQLSQLIDGLRVGEQ